MSWLLIIITAGNITFSRIYENETDCTKFGQFYTQGIEHAADYACLTGEALHEYVSSR